jgi:hypothetical protein
MEPESGPGGLTHNNQLQRTVIGRRLIPQRAAAELRR